MLVPVNSRRTHVSFLLARSFSFKTPSHMTSVEILHIQTQALILISVCVYSLPTLQVRLTTSW